MAKHGLLRKLFILLWKNAVLRRRHLVQSVCEVLIPTLLFMGIVAIRVEGGQSITPEQRPAVVNATVPYPVTFCANLAKHTYNGTVASRTLAYTSCPGSSCSDVQSALVDEMVSLVSATLENALQPLCETVLGGILQGDHGRLRLEPRSNETAIVDENLQFQANRELYDGEMLGGIVFPQDFDFNDDGSVPDLRYTLRISPELTNTETDLLFPIFQLSGPGFSGQQYQDFVLVQNLLDLAFTQVVTGETLLPTSASIEDFLNIKYMPASQQMAYPAYLENNIAVILGYILPQFMVLSFCFIVPPILKRIVHEKETGIKELMKLMGLPNWMHWSTWYITALTTSAVTLVIVVCLVCIEWKPGTGRVFDYSNPFLVYVFFLLYAMALIMFLFMLSTFFDNANLALALGVIIHMITFVAPSSNIDDDDYSRMDIGSKAALALMPNIALWWGIKILAIEEGQGSGLQWSTLNDRPQPSDPMTMGLVWAMLAVDIVLYAIITWYVDGIHPGKYGVAKKWYFPFMKSYWCPAREVPSSDRDEEADLELRPRETNKDYFEAEPTLSKAGLVVRNLRKTFTTLTGEPTVAVDGVSFSAFAGQITALLGHNGAGKSTTMNVLTGLYSPSGGFAHIAGHDIRTHMDKARRHVGLCPQHNMLFPDLNVNEHFVFFAMLKGLSRKEAHSEAKRYTQLLDLVPKTDTLTAKLSGGMKRKVNLGVALIGGSSVVLLDEPTSGMDPEARRHIWDLLQAEKKDRTLLLTTHFMEEADVLGDRIAIMAEGRVQCYGSTLFLKRQFGKGYTLTMSRGPACDVEATAAFVRSVVPDAGVKSDASGELVLALGDSNVDKFVELFQKLEEGKTKLDVLNFGLSVTTMEDVFIKVGKLSSEAGPAPVPEAGGGAHNGLMRTASVESAVSVAAAPSSRRLKGLSLWASRMRALLIKRMLYSSRRYVLFVVMAILPFLLALICQLVINASDEPVSEFPARVLTLADYPDTVTLVQADDNNTLLMQQFAGLVGNVTDTLEQLSPDENMTAVILEAGESNLAEYRAQYVVAAKFSQLIPSDWDDVCTPELCPDVVLLTSIYNSVPSHARPIAQNLVSRTLLAHLEAGSGSKHQIITTAHPLPFSNVWLFDLVSAGFSPFVFAYGIALSTGVGILVAAFLIFPLKERVTNAKQVQMMTGMSPFTTFWLSNVIWDLSIYIVSMAFMVGILLALDYRKTFTTGEGPGTLILLLVLYAASAIPMSYVFSFTTKTASTGFAMVIVINILAGSIATTGVWLLRMFGSYNDSRGLLIASDVVRYIFVVVPAFPFSRAIMALVQTQDENNLCVNGLPSDTLVAMCQMFSVRPELLLIDANHQYAQCCKSDIVGDSYAVCGKNFTIGGIEDQGPACHTEKTMYTWDALGGINIDLIVLFANFILYGLLLIFFEYRGEITERVRPLLGSVLRRGRDRSPSGHVSHLDEDVAREQERARGLLLRGGDDAALVVSGLRKRFGRLRAVDGLSFAVKRKECFGLLGINGAGKTTTFRILTGDETASGGVATASGRHLANDRRAFLQSVGYCPQFDSIINVLTGTEMLQLMARLRGMHEEDVADEVDRWIKALGLGIYRDRRCGTYSGGNKRKLNVGMALVADPPVIFLDEPTTGVDPVARRKIWNIISAIQKTGQAVVLTSHSMEECEALCDRLGIMVNGQLKCLGGTQHLKSKFGQGYTVLVKLNTRDVARDEADSVTEAVKDFVRQQLESADIKDEHQDYLHFHISDPSVPWERLFGAMSALKERFSAVEDYSVSETTLEQVFLSFAKGQRLEVATDEGHEQQLPVA